MAEGDPASRAVSSDVNVILDRIVGHFRAPCHPSHVPLDLIPPTITLTIMCGIAGLIAEKDVVVRKALDAMVCAESHRGPDDSGSQIIPFGGRIRRPGA